MHDIDSDPRQLIEHGLRQHLPQSRLVCSERLNQALEYALFPGGKRMRPLLTLMSARAAGGCYTRALPVACAIEFLHTTSLIFDDLPSMDDAHLRRGSPALHLVFGEAVAQLTALALLNKTYALFGSPALIAEAAECLGADGMIGGQAIDLQMRSDGCADVPFTARNRKTSALMRLTFTAGAIACEAPPSAIAALAYAGECLGEAYQICDDLLDHYLEDRNTGKTSHQDDRHQRLNHAAEWGVGACQSHITGLIDEAKKSLKQQFGTVGPAGPLLASIDRIVKEFSSVGLATSCS